MPIYAKLPFHCVAEHHASTLDPAAITHALGVKPDHSRKVGERRTTQNGAVLRGVNRETFWRITPQKGKNIWSGDVLLEDYLKGLNREFAKHKAYFLGLASTGGYIDDFVGWFGETNLMTTLSAELMADTARLGIAIGFDIYLEEPAEKSDDKSSQTDEEV